MSAAESKIERQIARIKNIEKNFGKVPISEWYGAGRCLKAYLGLPDAMPALVYVDHGVPIGDEPKDTDFHTGLPMFLIRKGRVSGLKRRCEKESYVMGSPFVHYRRMRNVCIKPDAKGTIAFPSHSTHLIDVVLDWENYAESLLQLPEQFQPVRACLYWKDLLRDSHKPFLKLGIPVVTAGHMGDPEFANNFYEIISRCSFTTSNVLGSYGFYSVEMGIPFFLYGNEPSFNNWGGDSNRPSGKYKLDKQLIPGYEFCKRFHFDITKPVTIDPELRELCLQKLGAEETIDRNTLRQVIVKSLLMNGPRWIASSTLREVRRLLKS